MTGDYTLQIRVKNGPMLRAMRAAGFETAAALARAAGVQNTTVGDYLNLAVAPTTKAGQWRASVLRLSEHLRCLPEDLFPAQHLATPLARRSAEVDVSLDDIRQIAEPGAENLFAVIGPEAAVLDQERQEAVRAALATLRLRERDVLIARFGLDGGEPQTLEAIADRHGVTKDRIRQIEYLALHRMRMPGRARRLLAGHNPGNGPTDA